MMSLSDIGSKVGRRLWAYTPQARRVRAANEKARTHGLMLLAEYSRTDGEPLFKRVLVDGQWDNANYWIRYALVRRALRLSNAEENGLVGHYSRERVKEAFSRFGFRGTRDHGRHVDARDAFLPAARELLKATHSASDIHAWKLPGGLPGTFVHDGILKRQRRGDIDMTDAKLSSMVAEALSAIDAAERAIESTRPDLVVLSHMIEFSYSALAWAAVGRGIPVVVLYGSYGINRFLRLYRPEDLFSSPSRPTNEDAQAIAPSVKDVLSEIGRKAIEDRLHGNTADVSSIYAYRRRRAAVDRAVLASRFGWDAAKPVIGVYAPNWFDYPNGCGRLPFCDFREWAQLTLDAACKITNVNWLFKAHPCDEWYGSIRGKSLADMVDAANAPHVRLCDTSWNGRDLLLSLDGIVTVHGTVGLEAATLGKSVLVPYSGWYGGYSFVNVAASVTDYFDRLARRWWEEIDADASARRAVEFAGWCYAAPDWHGDWFLCDDANQDAIWWDIDGEFKTHAESIAREVDEIREWVDDGHRYFDIFKLRRANAAVMAHPRVLDDAAAADDPRRRQFLSRTNR